MLREEYVSTIEKMYVDNRLILFRFAIKRGYDEEDAADCISETFLQLLEIDGADEIQKFMQYTQQERKSFLFIVVANRLATLAKRKTTGREKEEKVFLSHLPLQQNGDDNPEKTLIQAEEAKTLRQAVRQLSETQQRIVTLHSQGYTPKEIGSTLNLTDTTVRTYRYRAIDRLRKSKVLQSVLGKEEDDAKKDKDCKQDDAEVDTTGKPTGRE